MYIPVDVTLKLEDPQFAAQSWATISGQVAVDKVYIEVMRGRQEADGAGIERVKRFFAARGVQTAGGIAYYDGSHSGNPSFCYTDAADRAYVRNAAQLAARHFNEVILDDFFFSATKLPSDIRAKGPRSWAQFRLATMDEVSRDLILSPMREVNPRVRVVIKYPNWYEGYQELGYDLKNQPQLFSGIYTGTETRMPAGSEQHLQQYQGYDLVRYLDNVAPGKNGGGWVDPYDIAYYDRYAEQLWITLFAKARELTLFNYNDLLQPLDPALAAVWQGQGAGTGFDYSAIQNDQRLAQIVSPSTSVSAPTLASVAGQAIISADKVAGSLGQPVGIASYKPLDSSGSEDYLHNYIGMIGVPLDLRPSYPASASAVFLTDSAAADPDIVAKIKASLTHGATVMITSGLVAKLQDRGLESIADIRLTPRKQLTGLDYADKPIVLPQIKFFTNDAGGLSGAGPDDTPIIVRAGYGRGTLDVLAVPDSPSDLYHLPRPALDSIRAELAAGMPASVPVHLLGASQVALFTYANGSLITESFLPDTVTVQVIARGTYSGLRDLTTGDMIQPLTPGTAPSQAGQSAFSVEIKPHSFRAFQLEK